MKLRIIHLMVLIGPNILLGLEADFVADSLHGSLGDIISFGWDIKHNPGATLSLSELDMEGTGIELLDHKLESVEFESHLTINAAVYDSTGIYYFPSQVLYSKSPEGVDSLFLRGPDLTIYSILTVSDTTFRDIKNLHRIRTPFNLMMLVWVLIAGALIALSYYAIKRFRHNKRVTVEPKIIVPPEQAHVIALRAFEQLKRSKYLRFEQFKEFYTDLSHVLKEYYENRYLIDALEFTTSELMYILEEMKEFEPQHLMTTSKILELADIIKFAKGTSTELESGEALNEAINIVNQTKVINDQGDNT